MMTNPSSPFKLYAMKKYERKITLTEKQANDGESEREMEPFSNKIREGLLWKRGMSTDAKKEGCEDDSQLHGFSESNECKTTSSSTKRC
jgi:hypothetical protein